MAGDLADIRGGLAARLRTINGLLVSEQIPEQITPPMAVIMLDRVDYHGAFKGGLTHWQFVISIFVGRMAEQAAQDRLDEYLSWSGQQMIRDALEADQSLGGKAQTCTVQAARAIRPMPVGDAFYLGVEFEVRVYA